MNQDLKVALRDLDLRFIKSNVALAPSTLKFPLQSFRHVPSRNSRLRRFNLLRTLIPMIRSHQSLHIRLQ